MTGSRYTSAAVLPTADMTIEVHPERDEPVTMEIGGVTLHLTIAQAATIRDALAEAVTSLVAGAVQS